MTTVWKFVLAQPSDVVTIEMPAGAKVLWVATQGGLPCIWARVNPSAPKVVRNFRWAGTGHPLSDEVGEHVGSWQMADGALVFHLFDMPTGETTWRRRCHGD